VEKLQKHTLEKHSIKGQTEESQQKNFSIFIKAFSRQFVRLEIMLRALESNNKTARVKQIKTTPKML
jgi:hypothetical protein